MVYGLGPRARRVYAALHERIVHGDLPPGAQLAGHLGLAAQFGVAPMTVRQVLGRLEEDGLVSRQPGRGTFVHPPAPPGILVVGNEAATRAALADHVARSGFRAVAASGPAEALAVLATEPSIALVLSDVRMPAATDGGGFIRAVRRRWPELPLVALIAYLDDLAELYGTEEWPVLILPKPVRPSQVDEVLRLAMRRPVEPAGASPSQRG